MAKKEQRRRPSREAGPEKTEHRKAKMRLAKKARKAALKAALRGQSKAAA